jgi:p-hydroxybenzoate 3-monooxygenase
MSVEATPVVIVGAGPAGLVIGHLLVRAGIPCIVLDRRARGELGGVPKAGVLEYRTVQWLRMAGIADEDVAFTVENGVCEFRTADETVVFDYGAQTGGRNHYVYPQHLLVEALAEAFERRGGDLRCESVVESVSAGPGAGARVAVRSVDGDVADIAATYVIGCDGARSTIAPAITVAEVIEHQVPARLLAVIGETPPIVGRTVYAAHPSGYAGQMRRGPDQTRFYLDVPVTTTIEEWPEQRIRAACAERLRFGSALDDVRFTDVSFVDLRMRMMTTMQQGPIFVAGDAAHLITPSGGKGMNLAVQDALELAAGLIARLGPVADATRLDAYSATRIPAIWKQQAFSRWMLSMMLAGSEYRGAPDPFGLGIRGGWIRTLQTDPLFAAWFAHAYAGVDPPST